MSQLVINDKTRALVAGVLSYATSHWYVPSQSKVVPGDDPGHVVRLNSYRCVFSFTLDQGSGKVYRHLSISVKGKGKYPHPFAAFSIADLFGFSGWDAKSVEAKPKDWLLNVNKKEHCIILVQEAWPPPSQKRVRGKKNAYLWN
jgi:hypothetical protein